MNKQHGGCSLANAGCDPFARTMPNVARREYPRDAAFQPERISVQCPARWPMAVCAQLFQIRPGQDEAVIVCFNDVFEVLGVGKTTDKDEKRMRWYGFFLLRGAVQYGDCLKPLIPVYLGNFAPKADLDIGSRLDLFDEVLRHRL